MPEDLLRIITRTHPERMRHLEQVPARSASFADWPAQTHPEVRAALERTGVSSLWTHQAETAEHAFAGEHVVLSTGTASGKSVAYLIPALTSVINGASAPNGRGSTALYLAPTKALAHDQSNSITALGLSDVRATTMDGDTSIEDRQWARQHANYVLTNPDMLHHSVLPGHTQWASFLRRLDVIIIDECHTYRGLFGAHVSLIVRRLRRIAAHYRANPVVIAASATVAEPDHSVAQLIGAPVRVVDRDGSPRGGLDFALWEPDVNDITGDRRSASAETADMLTDIVVADRQCLAFMRSRRGVEAIAMTTKNMLADVDPELTDRVAAYRGGYLPEERRALEEGLRSRDYLGMAATNALELGIDISGVDAVLVCGWPGTRASLWQQVGRAGRTGQSALAVFVARDDPLDTYVVNHPDSIFGQSVEATVFDPSNPHVLAPHLCAAAAEIPITVEDVTEWFPPRTIDVLDDLVAEGLLRKRHAGWYWTSNERAHNLADIRGGGDGPIRIVESGTGRVLGTVDGPSAHATTHPGAIYVHQSDCYAISELDLDERIAFADAVDVDYSTHARDVSNVTVTSVMQQQQWANTTVSLGEVDVTAQVVSYARRRILTGEFLGEFPLDLPPRTLHTQAVWWTASLDVLTAAQLDDADVGGAAHAAEHASIGLLPLFAVCDRWDIGGVSTQWHADTGMCTVFVYDGYPGGAGFAERGFHVAREWLGATLKLIDECPCADGCPACVQSPKCGNGNEPLDKRGAIALLRVILDSSPV